MIDLQSRATQAQVAIIVGVSQQAISAMVNEGKLACDGAPLGDVVASYCERLRDQAAGRLGDGVGGLDLVQERAALAREQRLAQAMKNAVSRGEYAPIGALSNVLGMASSAVVDRIDQLDGALRKACPDLPEDARATVLQVLASARNEWIRSTAKLITTEVQGMVDDGQDDDDSDTLLEAFAE